MTVNVTLSIDEDVLERARAVARHQGTSLNAMIREYLQRLAGKKTGAEIAAALDEMWKTSKGHSGGRTWSREELYEERLQWPPRRR